MILLLPQPKEEPVTDERFPFRGATPPTHALIPWHEGGVDHHSYVQADQWGGAQGFGDPLYGPQPGDWGYRMPPLHGAHPDGLLLQAVFGHATASVRETGTTRHDTGLGIPSHVPPGAFAHRDARDRWGTADSAETWWSETADPPIGGLDTWSAPASAATCAREKDTHGGSGSFVDALTAPRLCGSARPPTVRPGVRDGPLRQEH
jgi:hypothetical protein